MLCNSFHLSVVEARSSWEKYYKPFSAVTDPVAPGSDPKHIIYAFFYQHSSS